ncbi:exonuclease domain-containing protein [Telmatospirillum sp.]|uniref:3'-5' exonuclease n=1 Tax=Telmatospirillum sp. TaxID=2079197 RepID=UPI00284BB059|nr:exonuclease domain-containing protein [Telmatospirillum sp.]MDR3437499.1 exonuclease domain-containing protein [Telmatospirillum sp.]
MRAKWPSATLVLSVVFILHAACVLAAWLFLTSEEQPSGSVALSQFLFLVFAATGALLFGVLGIFRTIVGRPAKRLGIDVVAIAHAERCQPVEVERYASLARVAEAINILVAKFVSARAEVGQAVTSATATVETEKARLAAILNDLHEGVVLCNFKHQVVLYNQAALRLLQVAGEMGLGRPLFGLIAKEPVLHILDVLIHRPPSGVGSAPFVSGSTDGRAILQGRMSLVRTQSEISGYVIAFDDVTESVSALARRDALVRETIESLRGPVCLLTDPNGDFPAAARDIAAVVEHLTADYRSLLTGWWPMTDIHSADLFDFVIRRLHGSGLAVTMTGLPIWLHGDSHTLVLAIEALVRNIAAGTGAKAFDVGAVSDGRHGWICVSWLGGRIDDECLKTWQRAVVSSALGGMTVGDVMGHHTRQELIEENHDGEVMLRIALSLGREGQDRGIADEKLPPRPEFFDFDLLAQGAAGELGQVALRSLTYVVFDTETTGLHPTSGDQIVSLAAVRVVNGRILTGETFNRIVNPGRSIPPDSVKFHGITDDMVIDKPPLSVVLPQFKAYAADAVLVAHNAAFDLKFIRMREADSGVVFDNRVLDTMLLSSFVDGTPENQSLDAIADRYGIQVTDRHTALGDSLVTAAVLLRLIDALEVRGITTLDQAMTSLNMTMELHNRGLALS